VRDDLTDDQIETLRLLGWRTPNERRREEWRRLGLTVLKPIAAIAAVLLTLSILGRFTGVGARVPPPAWQCHTSACDGHWAGFDWAREHDIDDPTRCASPSRSFREGCLYEIEWQGSPNDL